MKMIKEDLIRGRSKNHKADTSTTNNHNVGNKILPITESTTTSSSSSSSLSSMSTSNVNVNVDVNDQKDEKVKGNNNKAKALLKLKEMLRWAAAVKADKAGKLGRKVLHFRNKSAAIKSRGFDEQSNDSPKISFRWEVESCSTTCSAASAPPSFKYDHCSQQRPAGSWITTDDDFVVLEL